MTSASARASDEISRLQGRGEVEHVVDRDAVAGTVGDQGKQGGAPDQEVRSARLDQASRAGVVEPLSGERRKPVGQLGAAQPHRRLVECRLTCLDAEHRGQACARVPGLEQVANPRERVTPALQPADQIEPVDVVGAVDANPAAPLGRRQQAHRVVLADRADRQLGVPRQAIDGHVVHP